MEPNYVKFWDLQVFELDAKKNRKSFKQGRGIKKTLF